MIAPLILALGLVTPLQQQGPPNAILSGIVRSEAAGAPLPFAVVEILIDGRTVLMARTDSAGRYKLLSVPPGRRRLLRVSHLSHASHQIALSIHPGAHQRLDIDLELKPEELPGVDVTAPAINTAVRDTVPLRQSELGTAGVRMLEATPGVAELGLADAAREVPGHEPPDPSDVVFVRGGTADLKLVLLNGAPVHAPFHIGGLINAIDNELLRSATLYKGGAPARFDGGLSYVMDMETRSGRSTEAHATAAVDLLAGRVVVEGPAGPNVTYLAGGRSVHGLGAVPFVDDAFPYAYGDGVARIDVDVGLDRSLTMTGFWNSEFVRLDTVGGLAESARWGNTAGSIRYRTRVGDAEAMFTVAGGHFRTFLPLGGLDPLGWEGVSRRARATTDFARRVGTGVLTWGANIDRVSVESLARSRGIRDSVAYQRSASSSTAGVYVDGGFTPFPNVRLHGGLRADVFSNGSGPHLAPRVALTYDVTERAVVTLTAGRYRQYVRAPDLTAADYATITTDRASAPALEVASASHYTIAIDQELISQLRLAVEGYYKRYEGVPTTSGADRAEASGADVWLRRSGDGINGWLGYSIAWIWFTEKAPFSSTDVITGQHLLSAGIAGPLMGNGTFEVRAAYGAGLPYTAIPEPEATTPAFGLVLAAAEPAQPAVNEPDEPYLRLDAQIARTFDATLQGFAFTITPYVKVLNALDRRDALFYHLDRRGESRELRALASLPVLPIVGFEWKF